MTKTCLSCEQQEESRLIHFNVHSLIYIQGAVLLLVDVDVVVVVVVGLV